MTCLVLHWRIGKCISRVTDDVHSVKFTIYPEKNGRGSWQGPSLELGTGLARRNVPDEQQE